MKPTDPKWDPTTSQDISAFLSFNISMAVIITPHTYTYFRTDEYLKATWMSERIIRDRFGKLCQYFHICDIRHNPAQGQPGFDLLAHVRPILETPHELQIQLFATLTNTIYEVMIAYTGCLGIKQFMPLKPTKRGIKVSI